MTSLCNLCGTIFAPSEGAAVLSCIFNTDLDLPERNDTPTTSGSGHSPSYSVQSPTNKLKRRKLSQSRSSPSPFGAPPTVHQNPFHKLISEALEISKEYSAAYRAEKHRGILNIQKATAKIYSLSGATRLLISVYCKSPKAAPAVKHILEKFLSAICYVARAMNVSFADG